MKNKEFLIAFFATIIRYYDYALFGLSASVLAKNFLPNTQDNKQIVGFFAIFSIAVIARPLGSLIFGYIGDKFGRIISLKISIILATISTILIGLTPSYSQIGIFATLILLLCRMIFLMSLAGEVDAIKIYVAEKINKSYKNLANGIVSCCSQIGALLAATAYHYSSLTENYDYFWRFNFIIGGIFGGLVIFMRSYFQESEEFLTYKEQRKNTVRKNLWQIIRDSQSSFIIAILVSGSIGGVYHFLVIFLGVFLSKIAFIIDPATAKIMNILLISTYALGALFSGLLADKIKSNQQIIFALILSIITAIIFAHLLALKLFIIYIPIILIFLSSLYTVPLQITLQSLFTTGSRLRLYSLSHSIGGMIFSSTTPLICSLLWQYYESTTIIIGFFIYLLLILLGSGIYLYRRIM